MNSYSSDNCINTRDACPSRNVSNCTHFEDISMECSKFSISKEIRLFSL